MRYATRSLLDGTGLSPVRKHEVTRCTEQTVQCMTACSCDREECIVLQTQHVKRIRIRSSEAGLVPDEMGQAKP
jgi:hypothetical protein